MYKKEFKEFWTKVIQSMNNKSSLYKNRKASGGNWMSAKSGVRGVGFQFYATKRGCRAAVYIDRGKNSEQENEFIFDELLKQKRDIESAFGEPLKWQKLEEARACRIKAQFAGNVYDKEQWGDMIEAMTGNMVKLEKAFKTPISSIGDKLRMK